MTKIQNTRELPNDLLRCFAVSETDAQKTAIEYQSAWFYPLAQSDKGYLYILDKEYQEKKNNE